MSDNDIEKILEKSKSENVEILEGNTSFKNKEDKHFHWVRILFIWVASIILMVMGGIMAWHFIAPTKWRWLSEQEIVNLKNMAVTGILGAVLGKFGNKIM